MLVVGPQRDSEVVTHIDARLRTRLKLTHWAIGFGKTASNLEFELHAGFPR
jgi:hypothetical protein